MFDEDQGYQIHYKLHSRLFYKPFTVIEVKYKSVASVLANSHLIHSIWEIHEIFHPYMAVQFVI
jgi:hypothetical protein